MEKKESEDNESYYSSGDHPDWTPDIAQRLQENADKRDSNGKDETKEKENFKKLLDKLYFKRDRLLDVIFGRLEGQLTETDELKELEEQWEKIKKNPAQTNWGKFLRKVFLFFRKTFDPCRLKEETSKQSNLKRSIGNKKSKFENKEKHLAVLIDSLNETIDDIRLLEKQLGLEHDNR